MNQDNLNEILCLKIRIEKWETFANQIACEVNCLPDYLNPDKDNNHIIDAIRNLKKYGTVKAATEVDQIKLKIANGVSALEEVGLRQRLKRLEVNESKD